MAAMPVEARVARVLLDALGVEPDGFVEASEVGRAATQPDERVGVVLLLLIRGPRLGQLRPPRPPARWAGAAPAPPWPRPPRKGSRTCPLPRRRTGGRAGRTAQRRRLN